MVIGVAEDVHAESVEGENGWQIYYPGTQKFAGTTQLVVRTALPPAQMANSVMGILREMNAKQTAAEFKPIQMLVDHANSPRRFFMLLVASFADLGLLLAGLGIYGVISYSVTRQTCEIGIRMALGSSAGRVQREVLMGTLRLAFIGDCTGMRSFDLCVAPDCDPAVRDFDVGHRHLHRHGAAAGGGRRALGLSPRAPRLAHQPAGRPARQLTVARKPEAEPPCPILSTFSCRKGGRPLNPDSRRALGSPGRRCWSHTRVIEGTEEHIGLVKPSFMAGRRFGSRYRRRSPGKRHANPGC